MRYITCHRGSRVRPSCSFGTIPFLVSECFCGFVFQCICVSVSGVLSGVRCFFTPLFRSSRTLKTHPGYLTTNQESSCKYEFWPICSLVVAMCEFWPKCLSFFFFSLSLPVNLGRESSSSRRSVQSNLVPFKKKIPLEISLSYLKYQCSAYDSLR